MIEQRRLLTTRGAGRLLASAVLILASATAGSDPAASLKLRMETHLGRLAPAERATAEDSGLLPPVLLGTTSLRYRVEGSRLETRRWEEANASLAEHLQERERHIQSLRKLVERQDHAIAALKQQTDALKHLAERPPPRATTGPAPAPASGPALDTDLFGVRLQANYLLGGLAVAVLALLTWALHLRAQVRGRDRDIGTRVIPAPVRRELERKHAEPRAPAQGGEGRPRTAPDEERAPESVARREDSKPDRPEHAMGPTAARGEERVTPSPDSDADRPAEPQAPMAARAEPAPPSPASPAAPRPRSPANASALKEVDTLIAFENYAQASTLLNQLLDESPDNPEYRLRLLHILSAGGDVEASAEQEEILAAMMDGPLSETLARVRRMGQDLLPGHPLFRDLKTPEPATEPSGLAEEAVFDVLATDEVDGSSTGQFDPLALADPEPEPSPPAAEGPVDDGLEEFIKTAFEAPLESTSAGAEDTRGRGQADGSGAQDLEVVLDLEPEVSDDDESIEALTAIDLSEGGVSGLEDDDDELPPLEFDLSDEAIAPIEAPRPRQPAADVDGESKPEPDEPERAFAAEVFELEEPRERSKGKG